MAVQGKINEIFWWKVSSSILPEFEETHGCFISTNCCLTKQIQVDNNSNMVIPRTLHYFEPVQLMVGLPRNSDIMQHFVGHPQLKLTTCGECIYEDITSATYLIWAEFSIKLTWLATESASKEGSLRQPSSFFDVLSTFLSPPFLQQHHKQTHIQLRLLPSCLPHQDGL